MNPSFTCAFLAWPNESPHWAIMAFATSIGAIVGTIPMDRKVFSRKPLNGLLRQAAVVWMIRFLMWFGGKRNVAEEAREGGRSFQGLLGKHHAVESDINCLEHHGLNRCPDKVYPLDVARLWSRIQEFHD